VQYWESGDTAYMGTHANRHPKADSRGTQWLSNPAAASHISATNHATTGQIVTN
jgi:hypothetical protein